MAVYLGTLSPGVRRDFYGVLLVHGEPGNGKTTLCRALAQKLSIRLSKRFTGGRLIEIDCNALLSKWFGESGKRLGKVFDSIITMAQEDGGTNVVCVLLDEVETIARSRESVGDVPDAMRVSLRPRFPASEETDIAGYESTVGRN